MPSLPVYESEKTIKAQKAAPEMSGEQRTYKADKSIQNALSDIAKEWSDAHDVMQYTDAKGRHQVAMSEIATKAAQDPDFKNSQEYVDLLQKAKESSIKGVDNAMVRDQLSMEMDFGNQMAAIKIDANFKQKELAHNKFQLEQSIEGLNQKRVNATTEKEALQYDSEINKLLVLNTATGTIDEAEAKKYLDGARTSSAEYDATVNPEAFLERNAKWYGIPNDEFIKLKKTARESQKRTMKEAEIALAEIQDENEADLTMKLVDQSIDRASVPEISKMIRNQDITEEFGLAYIRMLTDPGSIGKAGTKIKKKSNKVYLNMAKELFKAENPEETRKALINMFDETASGAIKEDEISMLLKAASETNKKSLISGILNAFDKSEYNKNEITKGFFEQIINGKDPEEAKAIAIDEQNIKENPLRTEYSIGDLVDTPMGTMYVWGYYDDGEPDVRLEKPPKK